VCGDEFNTETISEENRCPICSGDESVPLVYVAGPFRARTPWEVEQNIRRAERVALEVARAGAMPICPHTNTRFFNGQLTDGFWIRGTLELLRRADGVVFLSGWQESSGSVGEHEDAVDMGLPLLELDTIKVDRKEALKQFVRGLE
jgi:hypothetical protein